MNWLVFGLQLEHFQLAHETCLSALEHNTDDGLAHALLGETLSEMGDQEQAHKHLQKALQIAQDQTAPWLAMENFIRVEGLNGLG